MLSGRVLLGASQPVNIGAKPHQEKPRRSYCDPTTMGWPTVTSEVNIVLLVPSVSDWMPTVGSGVPVPLKLGETASGEPMSLNGAPRNWYVTLPTVIGVCRIVVLPKFT